MITYAGVDLPLLTDAVRDHLETWWHARSIVESTPDGYYVPGPAYLPRPAPPRSEPPRPGVLRWPTGASRWATYHHVVDATTLDAIQSAGDGAQALEIDDGQDSISADMYLLPPRPIAQNDQDGDLYLLSLVDERWYWWREGSQPNITKAPESWADLFDTLTGGLGVSAEVDEIPEGYSTPTDRWVVSYQPLPVLLDAAARSVGCRVVRRLDGTVLVRRWDGASADSDSQWAANETEVETGGIIAAADIAATVPGSCAVIFFGDEPAQTTLALSDLSLPEYEDAEGLPGYVGQFNADVQAADTDHQDACATEAASDYYRWLLPAVDATFRGVVAWVPTGAEDVTEWEQCADKILTRVVRPPWGDANVYAAPRPLDGRWGVVTGAGVPGSSASDGSPTAYSFQTVILDASFNYVEVGAEIELAAYPLPDKTGYPPDVPTDRTAYAWFWRSKTQPGKWEFQYTCCCPPRSSSSSSSSGSSSSGSSTSGSSTSGSSTSSTSESGSSSQSESLSGSSSNSQSASGSSSNSQSASGSSSESESISGSGCGSVEVVVSVTCSDGVLTTTTKYLSFANGCLTLSDTP
ncbi:hypothetical protein [Fimbriiglobus ruber]|uniref:Uncharacterized protein n=1 Tax=Fimbriiglobus ruber TaxID=1908690 RepID=A0A225E6K9_9BACT|nr:hypothetical protein [Fimbriiglobus ruber]OWK45746.1 hypothetical protein FRUB_02077 [Fimbriiglobus ruber]